MKYTIRLLLSLLLLTSVFQKATFACGTLDDWINIYHGKRGLFVSWQGQNKKKALVGIYECGRYHYSYEDKRLLPVLVNALHNIDKIDSMKSPRDMDRKRRYVAPGSTKRLLEEIYRRYNCLSPAKNEAGYQELVKEFGDQNCPGKTPVQMKVNVQTTAHIRLWPDGTKIGYLKKGNIVNVIAQLEEWTKINIPGKVRDSERIDVGYIHSSLLVSIN